MCEHKEFRVLYYKNSIIVRQCLECGEVEVITEGWLLLQEINSVIEEINRMTVPDLPSQEK